MRSFGYISIGFISFLLASIVWNSVFFHYESSMSYVLIPRSDVATMDINGVMDVASKIPETQLFMGRVQESYSDIPFFSEHEESKDLFALWKRQLETRVDGRVLTLIARGDTAYEAEQLVRASANTFSSTLFNSYYSRADIGIRIFEYPITVSRYILSGIVVNSLFALIVVGIVFLFTRYRYQRKPIAWKSYADIRVKKGSERGEYIEKQEKSGHKNVLFGKKGEQIDASIREVSQEKIVEGVMSQEKENYQEEEKRNHSSSDEKLKDEVLEQKTSLSEEGAQKAPEPSSVKKENVQEKIAPTPSLGGARGAVPFNLPIVSEESTIMSKKEPENTSPSFEKSNEEPDNEEYKKRLNELLKGNMI